MKDLQGILTTDQRAMGFNLSEDDHCVYMKKGNKLLATWPAPTVTFAEIQREAYQEEQRLKSGVEVCRG